MTPQVCFTTAPELPRELDGLSVLASDFAAGSIDSAVQLFRDLDPNVFNQTGGNPFATLLETMPARFAELVNDRPFVARVEAALVECDRRATGLGSWYMTERNAPRPLAVWLPRPILEEDVCPRPHLNGTAQLLESASRLGVPLVHVELACSPYDHTAPNARAAANTPFTEVKEGDGGPMRICVPLPHTTTVLRVFRATWGPSSLLLLAPETGHDLCLSESRGDDAEVAMSFVHQVGAVKALAALGVGVPVWQVDAALPFAALERVAHLMEWQRVPFHVASQVIAAATLSNGSCNIPGRSVLPYLAQYAERLDVGVDVLADLLHVIVLDPIDNEVGTTSHADAALRELVRRAYLPRAFSFSRDQCDDFKLARTGASHRARILSAWSEMSVADLTPELPLRLRAGSYLDAAVAVRTTLASSDVRPEITVGTVRETGDLQPDYVRALSYSHTTDAGHIYNCRVRVPESPGTFGYAIAVRPNLLAPWCRTAVTFPDSPGAWLAGSSVTASIPEQP
jgi:hypothetical protein